MRNLTERIDVLINLIDKVKVAIDIIENSKELKDYSEFHKQGIHEKTIRLVCDLTEKLNSWKTQTFSKQLLNYISNVLEQYDGYISQSLNIYNPNLVERFKNVHDILLELENETKRIDYLLVIKNKNVVLVGGNGAGKSSFASFLKDSLSDNIIVIPAQKFLFFDLHIDQLHLMDKEKIKSIQKDNFIRRGRFEDNQDLNYEVTNYTNDLSQIFSKFITVLVNEQINQEHNLLKNKSGFSSLDEKLEVTILYDLNSLWKNLIPDIKFEVDTMYRTLIPIKDGKKYTLNAMSDGEKSMLYYISYVLLAEPNSFIVVDEPETFLNASNFNRLWDALEAYKPDCKYIYISHVVDFIVSRTNSDLLWCKNFTYPDTWDIEPIYDGSELTKEFPRDLLSELLGARRTILFCEGDKSSLDYAIYSSLFKNELIVYPVGGHVNVIQYTRSYNDLSEEFNGNNAIGIIDSDLMEKNQIESYRKDKIYTLNFNEIEMLLLTEEVITDVLKHFLEEDNVEKTIKSFKSKFFDTMSKSIEKISFDKIKKYTDTELSNFRISKSKTPEEISTEVKEWFDCLNVSRRTEQFKNEITTLIQEKNYEELLKVCPLKGEISRGIANIELDSKYTEKALNRVKLNEILAKNIKDKYFKNLEF